MKNLKNIFAKTLLLFSVLAVFASCKKDKDTKPEDSFDPTKYYITGEGADSYSTSYAIILKPNAMGYFTAWGGSQDGNFNYKYEVKMKRRNYFKIILNLSNQNHLYHVQYRLIFQKPSLTLLHFLL